MIVPSLGFFGFCALVVVLIRLSGGVGWRRSVLFSANLVFVSTFVARPSALVPLFCFVLGGFGLQRFCPGRERALPAFIVLTVLCFAWLKRYTLIPAGLELPFAYTVVGLSYIFFRVLHVIIDRSQGAIAEPIAIVPYLNYVLNFTTLVSGPIQRYQDFQSSEASPLPLDLRLAGRAFERVIVGAFKVQILSNGVSLLQHAAMASLHAEMGFLAKAECGAAIIGSYPLYLYFNFSGYTDVVIGIALLLGVVLPENFDRPFLAENVITFWNRWHMTLSGWLKTYVFNPIMLSGMSRFPDPSWAPYISVVALFVTFFLVGIWHGQTSSFIVFGLLTGGGVAANKLWQMLMQHVLGRSLYRKLSARAFYRAICRGLNYTWFSCTLLWFWSDWTHIVITSRQLGATGAIAAILALLVLSTIALSAVGALALNPGGRSRYGGVLRSRYTRTAAATVFVLMLFADLAIVQAPPADIVYKAF